MQSRLFSGLLAFLPLIAASTVAWAQPSPPPVLTAADIALLQPYASTADSVRLPDGREIHLVCMGSGNPTVILSAGMGSWSIDWYKVQHILAAKTRVCAWDRAGWGLSDPSSQPQTVEHIIDDLRSALAAGGIAGPYVLVGGSLGGIESLLFADRWWVEVAGMVFVDSSIPGQDTIMARFGLARDPRILDAAAAFEQCAADLRKFGQLPDGCTVLKPWDLGVQVPAIAERIEVSSERFDTMASLMQSSPASMETAVNPTRNFGDMPLIVLSAGNRGEPAPETPEAVKNQIAAFNIEFDHGHAALAALSTRGTRRVVPDSGHNIPGDDPQAVIDAILEVVEQARGGS